MSLLQALNLPAAQGGAIQPTPPVNITDTQGYEVSKNGGRPVAVPSKAPDDLAKKLDQRGQTLRDAYGKLAAAQTALEARIASTSGDPKAAAQTQKQDVDKALAGIDRQLKQNDADRTALASPATDAKAMNEILARSRSPIGAGKAVEVDRHDDPVEKKWATNRTTTTTTEGKDGKSTTTTGDRSTTLGPGSVTKRSSDATDEVTADGKTSRESGTTTKVNPNGYARESVDKQTVETKGQTTSTETKTKVDVGPGGAGASVEEKRTAADGSSRTTAGGAKLERADGKVGVAADASHARTDADGNTVKGGGSTKGGLQSKDGGVGAYANSEGSIERKGSKGLATGLVAGLEKNISCNIKAKEGTDPPMYEVSLNVNLGASVKGNAGYDKEGGVAKGGLNLSGGASVSMSRTYPMSEAEAQGFVAALRNKGVGGGSQRELAIIRAGFAQGWVVAQKMYLGLPVGSSADLVGMKAGEKTTVGKKKSGGVGLSAEGGGVGATLGVEHSDESEMTVTKEADGGATYDTKKGAKDKGSAGATVSAGVVKGSFGASKTVTTATGWKFRVKPDMADAQALADQIAALANASEADIEKFARDHPDTVVSRSDTQDTSRQNTAGMGIGPAEINYMDGHGVEDTVVRDAKGNVIDTRKRGHNEGGMSAKVAGVTFGSQVDEQAAPRDDASGDRVYDVTGGQTDSSLVKILDGMPVVGSKKKKESKGAIETASGAKEEEDTTTRNVAGMTMTAADLKALVAATQNRATWNNAAISWGRDIKAWSKAADKIAASNGDPKLIEAALSDFVGGDNLRKEVVWRAVRPGVGDKSAAKWEFPESVKSVQQDYLDVVVAESDRRIVADGKDDAAKGQATGTALLETLRRLEAVIGSAQDFQHKSVQGEMLARIAARRARVSVEMRKLQGVDAATAEKEQERPQFEQLFANCQRFKNLEQDLFAKVEDEHKKKLSNADPAIVMALTVELKNLYGDWTPAYEKMATAAQKNGWQKDNYWQFRPDMKRFNEIVKTGGPGKATPQTPDTVDRTKEPEKIKSAEEVKADDAARWKKFDAMKAELKSTGAAVTTLATELKELYGKAPNTQVEKLFGQANGPVSEGDRLYKALDLNHMPKVFETGPVILQKYRDGLALLRKARALYPKK